MSKNNSSTACGVDYRDKIPPASRQLTQWSETRFPKIGAKEAVQCIRKGVVPHPKTKSLLQGSDLSHRPHWVCQTQVNEDNMIPTPGADSFSH